MTNELQPMGQVTALSIVENINAQALQASLQKIKTFQSLVQSQFSQGHDYGIIPYTGNKPVLLKPGAEKLLMLLGLSSNFEIMDSTRDFDSGFFQYQVKCILSKDGYVITEGMGTANTRESKYIKQDPYSFDNTVLKMAKKRALVDAALLVGSLSDIFTQDLEDMDLQGSKPSKKRYYTDQDGTISKAQANRLFALGDGDVEMIKSVTTKYGYTRSDEIKKADYEKICKEVEALKNKKVVDKAVETKENTDAQNQDKTDKKEEQDEVEYPPIFDYED